VPACVAAVHGASTLAGQLGGGAGKLDPPLGQNRLKILEVLLALVSLKSPAVEAKLIELSVLPTVLDLFFKYEWHNLLHNLVKSLLEIIIKGEVRGGCGLRCSRLAVH